MIILSEINTNIYKLSPKLNIADIGMVKEATGPGNRLCIWLQGCRKNCQGCYNQGFRNFMLNSIVDVDNLVSIITKHNTEIDGISISGGEPLLQAQALIKLLDIIGNLDLSVIVYSGYSYSELKKSKQITIQKFLSLTDVLIDGEYEAKLAVNSSFISTRNQKIHFLSEKYSTEDFTGIATTYFSLSNSVFKKSGNLPSEIEDELLNNLSRFGIRMHK
jgi:anaerobic ribonucleoside-triphosphate reductase activating protein